MALLRDGRRYSAYPGQLAGRLFDEGDSVRSSRQEGSRPRYDLRPTCKTAAVSLDRVKSPRRPRLLTRQNLRQARHRRAAGFQLVQAARRDDGLSLIRCPSITSQACSAAANVLNGEPTTLTAGLF